MNKRQYKKLYSNLPSKKYLLDAQVVDYHVFGHKRRRARLNALSYREFGSLYKMRKVYADVRKIANIVASYQGKRYIFGDGVRHEETSV